jgi:hypothetical protein
MKNGLIKSLLIASTLVCVTSPFAGVSAFAADSDGAAISIEKPEGWKQGETMISVTVDDSHLGDGVSVSKIEAKAGDGSWTDITSSRSISISQNTTVYVRVTDSEGNVYEQNRSIRCYDSEKPTLTASLSDGVLTIKGNDSVAGIASITVNGTTYTELTDGTLKVQLTQKDFTTKKIEIYATDEAGNTSDTYSMQNPYYEWAVKQAAQQSSESSGLSTTTDTETEVTSPLPQDAEASEPTEAKGTVDDRTVTGIEEQLAESGETAESITQTTTQAGKEFYTISTKSGKIFYLIVDNEKQQDNVYFLTEVSEQDLMNFTLSDTVTLPDVDTVYATVDNQEEETVETEVVVDNEETEEEVQMPEEKSSLGSYLLIALLAAGVGGGAYYFKVYKPKHEEEDFDETEGENEEDMEPTENDDAEDPDDEDSAEGTEEHPVLEDEADEGEDE